MKLIKTKIKIAVIAMMGMSLGVKAQEWDSNGDNTTTGGVRANFFDVENLRISFGNKSNNWSGHDHLKNRAFFYTNSASKGMFFSSYGQGASIRFQTGNAWSDKPEASLILMNDGNVGIGTTSPNAKLDVNGVIQVGSRDATRGGVIIAQKYRDNDYLGTLSSNCSSGALIMGYGAAGMPNQGSCEQLFSTFDNFNGYRSAIRVASGTFEFISSPTKLQTPVGQQITVKSRFFINNQGKVGIGNKSPGSKLSVISSENDVLHLSKSTNYGGDNIYLAFSHGNNTSASNIRARIGTNIKTGGAGRLTFHTGSAGNTPERLRIDENGNVGINTTEPDSNFKLSVNGSIRSKEVKVEANWSDFVFYDNYELRTLEEVEQHINEKGHLPEIPNEEEVTENGINLGEMNAKLLQKIEELTLYLIEQNKEIKELKDKFKHLETK